MDEAMIQFLIQCVEEQGARIQFDKLNCLMNHYSIDYERIGEGSKERMVENTKRVLRGMKKRDERIWELHP